MASKKDLIEAQAFSRRRLLSAFTGGAPGGKELEPARPLRAVVAGVALTAGLLLAGVFIGLINPGLPQGWENGRLILVRDTGARYLSADGILHPVVNTTSARLLVPADRFTIISTDAAALDGIEVGGPLGILGAPDELPAADRLVADGWTACPAGDGGTAVRVGGTPAAAASDGGTVVTADGGTWVLAGGARHPVADDEASAVLRAVGLDAVRPTAVEPRFLALFAPGSPLTALVVDGAGADTASGVPGIPVGAVVHAEGSPDDERYVLQADGRLAPISPLAYRLYLLGTGAALGAERTVQPSELAAVENADAPAQPADWPADVPAPLAAPCALLVAGDGSAHAVLAEPGDELPAEGGTTVARGAGALVGIGGADGDRLVRLIDERATAYAVTAPAVSADDAPQLDELLARLGYAPDEVAPVDPAWLEFFAAGPALSPDTAGTTPGDLAAAPSDAAG